MEVTTLTSDASAEHLRADMIIRLQEQGYIRSPQVADAFAQVPREIFAPEATLSAAYSCRDVVVTKRNAAGRATSSISAPWLQAEMIHAARLSPGERVLEIGSGGYNAALLAEIVGPEGQVVTVDIDPWVTERATRFLAEAGYPHVTVVLGDAEHAVDEYGPFDAILVTVGAWDAPWGRLLAPQGRMVVPIIFKALTRSITFVRDGNRYVGREPTVCGFVPMQGVGSPPGQDVHLADGAVQLSIEGGPDLDAASLAAALSEAPTELWTGVTVAANEPFDTLNLWLATEDEQSGILANPPGRECDLVTPAMRWYCPALITPDGFAYLSLRRIEPAAEEDKVRFEFGVLGHGRRGAELARRLHDHVQTWNSEWRSHPGPSFTLYPVDAPVPEPAVGRVFRKRHTRLVMDWGG